MNSMFLSNTDTIPGKKYQILTLASGVGHCHSLLKLLTDGVVSGIAQSIHDAEYRAIGEMIDYAKKINGDGIIGIRFTSINLGNVSAVLASGTVIKFVE